ncbi:unnamed protein product [Paramecium primaurelia]|uniref:Uncharacterized protein n=1 Tax=Paramecium primaurelia TaxID=5886 RepID=A0A8S1QP68_PARPR|nr:unnamed protein product [Paramecium primaurelia]
MFSEFIKAYPKFQTLLYILGILGLLKCTKILCFLWKLFRPSANLEKYGTGSWVFITGASDGIGKQLAIKFSQRGFKIILVARTRSKLEAVSQQLQTESHIIVADFTQSMDNKLFDRIIDEVGERDVSIVINNVGVDAFNRFHLISDEEVYKTIIVNCMPVTMLCKRFIPQLLKRKSHKSAIINVTSLAGQIPTPYFNVYSASKSYGEFLTQTLSVEYPELEIFALRPSEVSTNMTFNRKPDLMTITSSDCADGLLKRMGQNTNGHWNHEIQAELYKLVPSWLYNWVLIKFIAPQWLKERTSTTSTQKKNN